MSHDDLPRYGRRIARLKESDPHIRVVPIRDPPGYALSVRLRPVHEVVESAAAEIRAELPEANVTVDDGRISVDGEPVGLLGPSYKWLMMTIDPEVPDGERYRAANRFVDAYLPRPIPRERWSAVKAALLLRAEESTSGEHDGPLTMKELLRNLTLTALVEAMNGAPLDLPLPLLGLYIQYKVGDLVTARLLGPDWRRKAEYVALEADRQTLDYLSETKFWEKCRVELFYRGEATEEERAILELMLSVTAKTGRLNLSEAHRRYRAAHPERQISRPTFSRRWDSICEKLTA